MALRLTKVTQIRCAGHPLVRILTSVIGEDFPAVLAAAQGGSEAAFATLWRDGNHALLRYLRVAARAAAEDVAAETWVQAVRGQVGFIVLSIMAFSIPTGHRGAARAGHAAGRPGRTLEAWYSHPKDAGCSASKPATARPRSRGSRRGSRPGCAPGRSTRR